MSPTDQHERSRLLSKEEVGLVDLSTHDINQALGAELKRTREERGLSRKEVVEMVPEGVGDRSLLAHEVASRRMLQEQWIMYAIVLRVDPSVMLARGLQRALLAVDRICLIVDLRQLIRSDHSNYQPLMQWAKNALREYRDGIAVLYPDVVKNLAMVVGCTHKKLADYIAQFMPDESNDSIRAQLLALAAERTDRELAKE